MSHEAQSAGGPQREVLSVHDVIEPLTPKELRKNRFGLLLFVTSQLVPTFVLINVRFMLADDDVSAQADPLLGGLLPVLLFLLGAVPVWRAVRFAAVGSTDRMRRQLALAGVVGVVGLITQIWPLIHHRYDALAPFGEVHLASVGVGGFFTLVTLILLYSVIARAGRGQVGPEHYWGVEATGFVWSFNAVSWLAIYIVMFWL